MTPLLTKKIISLDIGTQNTKIIIGNYQKNKVYIEKAIIVDTPFHTIEDGNILDKLRISSELKSTLGVNSVKTKEINCTTNSTSIINREITIPKAEDGDLETIVNFEIQQYLPIIMEDYIVQHKVIETIKDESSDNPLEKLRVFVVVYPKTMAETYLDMFQDAGLRPNVLDVNFNSINKLFSDCVEINEEKYITNTKTTSSESLDDNMTSDNEEFINNTIAVVDMGAENLSVNILSNGQIDFSRITTNGGSAIDKLIAREYDITLEEAEKRKKEYSDLLGLGDVEHMAELNNLIKEELNGWIEEINRIIQFYKNKKAGNKVDKIFIHGGNSRLKGIEEYMSRILNIQVIKIRTMDNVILGKDVDKEQLDLYLNAIGAIIRF
jgi:type IV pilus assembly protein PilM